MILLANSFQPSSSDKIYRLETVKKESTVTINQLRGENNRLRLVCTTSLNVLRIAFVFLSIAAVLAFEIDLVLFDIG